MKTANNRLGFTLVELLVVMSIIAVLAALLFPAIQAAKELARRMQCTNNQRQVAIALQNFEATKGGFPALRAPMKPAAYWSTTTTPTNAELTELTWVGFVLPFIEMNPAWQKIKDASLSVEDAAALFDLPIPVMQCPSSGISAGESRISYVANAGPLNDETAGIVEYGNGARTMKDDKMYTIFFDHFAEVGPWSDVPTTGTIPLCKTRVTMDNVGAMDGTSQTILISENEDAGNWIWKGTDNIPVATVANGATTAVQIEAQVGFCYPFNLTAITANPGETPNYIPSSNPTDPSPMFINEGRRSSGFVTTVPARTARPSSGHPGVVIAAFCDGHAIPLRDEMDKTLFVRLCRPGCGVIIKQTDL